MDSISSGHQYSRVTAVLRSPGLWLLIGGLEVLFSMHLSEFLYPGYSQSENYISDLGVGPMPSSAVFTVGVILFGLMALVAAVLLRQMNGKSRIWLLVALTGIGAVGVGAFNMDYSPWVHRGSALLTFLFGNLAALYSYKIIRRPLSYVCVILGLIGFSALGLYGAQVFLGLGIGGMERMIVYPAMFWAVIYGVYLSSEEAQKSEKP